MGKSPCSLDAVVVMQARVAVKSVFEYQHGEVGQMPKRVEESLNSVG